MKYGYEINSADAHHIYAMDRYVSKNEEEKKASFILGILI